VTSVDREIATVRSHQQNEEQSTVWDIVSVDRHTGTAFSRSATRPIDFQELSLDSCHMGLVEADDVDLPLMNVIADDAGLAQDRPSTLSWITLSAWPTDSVGLSRPVQDG